MKETPRSPHSMTSKSKCFYSDCSTSPSWGVESSAAPSNPDGTPWYLFACDEHEERLTADLRRAGTRYSLFPVIGPPIMPTTDVISYEEEFKKLPRFERWFVTSVTVVVTLIIGPPMLLYYGIRWLLGHKTVGKH